MGRLDGKAAVITGAAQGIGAQMARAMAANTVHTRGGPDGCEVAGCLHSLSGSGPRVGGSLMTLA